MINAMLKGGWYILLITILQKNIPASRKSRGPISNMGIAFRQNYGFAAAGYIVFYPNPRGVPVMGKSLLICCITTIPDKTIMT